MIADKVKSDDIFEYFINNRSEYKALKELKQASGNINTTAHKPNKAVTLLITAF